MNAVKEYFSNSLKGIPGALQDKLGTPQESINQSMPYLIFYVFILSMPKHRSKKVFFCHTFHLRPKTVGVGGGLYHY